MLSYKKQMPIAWYKYKIYKISYNMKQNYEKDNKILSKTIKSRINILFVKFHFINK